jgi:hypothetical protein
MNKPALLLSLLALAALGLVACGEGHDEDSATEAKVSAHTPPEGKLSREQAQELKGETLPREQVQELKREANTWAALFAGVATSQLVHERAAPPNACNRYVGQPVCERLTAKGSRTARRCRRRFRSRSQARRSRTSRSRAWRAPTVTPPST